MAEQPHDAKNLLIILSIIVGVLGLIFAGVALYNKYYEVEVVDIDQLHQDNLQNKLDEEEGYVYEGFSFVKAGIGNYNRSEYDVESSYWSN